MPKKVTVKDSTKPDDALIEIPGLGLLENNKTTEVDDGQVAVWESLNPGKTLMDNDVFETTEPEGPTDMTPQTVESNEVLPVEPESTGPVVAPVDTNGGGE